jgi:hypothetical protein
LGWINSVCRNQSERIRNEAVRLMREREDKTVMTQRDSDRRIGERLHDEVIPNTVKDKKSSVPGFVGQKRERRCHFCYLRGQCHEIFDFRLFSSNNLPRALVYGPKPFRI